MNTSPNTDNVIAVQEFAKWLFSDEWFEGDIDAFDDVISKLVDDNLLHPDPTMVKNKYDSSLKMQLLLRNLDESETSLNKTGSHEARDELRRKFGARAKAIANRTTGNSDT
jgi:hypothetical protein